MPGRVLRLLLMAGALGLATAGCTYFVQRGPSPYRPPGLYPTVSEADTGRILYDRDCAWCHGVHRFHAADQPHAADRPRGDLPDPTEPVHGW
jgi:hypothetical protein